MGFPKLAEVAKAPKQFAAKARESMLPMLLSLSLSFAGLAVTQDTPLAPAATVVGLRLHADRLAATADQVSRDSANTNPEIAFLERARKGSPADGAVGFWLASAYARAGNKAPALAILRRFRGLRLGLIPADERDFGSLWNDADLQTLRRELLSEEDIQPADLGFSFPDKRFIPEGLAYDSSSNRFFLGSLAQRKIVVCHSDGTCADFGESAHAGMWQVLGLRVDPVRKSLWAVSSSPEDAGASSGASALFQFDLSSGRLLRRFTPVTPGHFLNDLAISRGGDIFVTDTANGSVLRLAKGEDTLREFLPASKAVGANGIAVDSTRRRVYVADWRGILEVDELSRAVRRIPSPARLNLASIDGLYLVDDGFIAIQNAVNPGRVLRITMDPAHRRITKVRVLAAYDRRFNTPTTGVPVNGVFWFIANSQVTLLGSDGSVAHEDALSDVYVMKVHY